MKAKNIILNMF